VKSGGDGAAAAFDLARPARPGFFVEPTPGASQPWWEEVMR